VTVSDDGNCIGSFNADALDGTCGEDPSLCAKWNTAGALGAFITLEEADGVHIKEINKSLCAYLAGEAATKCSREGGSVAFKGYYCSTDDAAGVCQDSVW